MDGLTQKTLKSLDGKKIKYSYFLVPLIWLAANLKLSYEEIARKA